LIQNNLVGKIPTSLGNMGTLTELVLYGNTLTGVIPPMPFSQYTRCCLQDPLVLNSNSFTCPLPAGSDACKYCGNSAITCSGSAPTSSGDTPGMTPGVAAGLGVGACSIVAAVVFVGYREHKMKAQTAHHKLGMALSLNDSQ